MKQKVFFFTLVFLLLSMVFVVNASAQAVTVKAQIDKELYEVGEFLTLKVFVNENPGLHSLFCDLTFDGSVLEYISLNEGGLITGENHRHEFLYAVSDPVTSNARGDHLILSYALQGAQTETKRTGLLCEIRFRVKSPGSPELQYAFNFRNAAATDGSGAPLSGVTWEKPHRFSIGSKAYRSFVLITKPSDMDLIYTDEIEVKAVSSTGGDYFVKYENETMQHASAEVPARETNLPGRTLPITYGYNSIVATLYQRLGEQDYIIAMDRVRVYRPENDRFIKILSPKANQLVNNDMLEVIVSSPFEQVTVNGLSAQYQAQGADENNLYRTRLWLRNGFNTITAEATGPENVKYKDTIRVYYQKDTPRFSFVQPRTGQYFKSGSDSFLRIKGEIDSLNRTGSNPADGLLPNTVTLEVIYRPNNPNQTSVVLVDHKLATVKENTEAQHTQARYEFYNDFEIPLAGLGNGEIEIIAYKNKEGDSWDDRIHRLVYLDDQRLEIDLVQPNVYSHDLLDTYQLIRSFNEAQDPTMENIAMSAEGALHLPPGQPVVTEESLLNVTDLAEDKSGVLYALTNDQMAGTMSVYRKGRADEEWQLVVTRAQMYGYTLCPTDVGVMVGVSNLYATTESGLYLLRGDKLVNIEFPVTIQHGQFVEERQDRVYIYGNYFNYLYSFDIHTLIEGTNGLRVETLDRIDFINTFNLKQFVLSPDCQTAILRGENGKIRFYHKTAAGYLQVSVADPEHGGDLFGKNVIAGAYHHGDYYVYLILKDDQKMVSVMEYKKGMRRFFTSSVNAGALLQRADARVYAAGFMNNAFYFLSQDTSANSYVVSKGQVFFTDFYQEGEDEYYIFPTTLEESGRRFLVTSQNQFYLGLDSALSGPPDNLYRLYHQLENKPGEISFNYVNDDIEGITAFSFEVDPLWLESAETVSCGFAVKEKSSANADNNDPVIFRKTKTSLQQLLAEPENSFYTLHHRYDPLVEREVIHVEFKHIQGNNRYLAFEFRLRPAGNSSPQVYNLKIFKKTMARICAAEGEELELPIHGFVHDRTVTEVNINQSRIALGRDGSFRYNHKIDRHRKQIPVEISCVNSMGDTAVLRFTVEVVTSENGLARIEHRREDGTYHPLPEDILTTTEEILMLSGEYYGLAGAVAGYELYGYEYQDGVETVNLVRTGLFSTTEDPSVYKRFDLDQNTIGSGFTAGYFKDQGIRLISGRQQLRVYTENPGGHRQVFQTDINYSMPPAEQSITFDLEALNPVELVQDVPIEYQLKLVAYEQESNHSPEEAGYVFARDYELMGEIKSLYTIPDLLVKSFTPGLVFANGEMEETVQVGAGNRFRIRVRLEMDAAQSEQNFYIGVIPKIPALLGLCTGIRITAGKYFQDTNFIPDFSRLHPDNWNEQEEISHRVPIRVKFNREDLPVPGSWLTLTVNHETVISGYLEPTDDGYYRLKDEHTQDVLELTGLKYGRNRIEWTLHYRDAQNGHRYTISSSNSGRAGMRPYLFDYLETIEGVSTEIWFSPDLTNQFYNADNLPELNIKKGKGTEVLVKLNGSLLAEDTGAQENLTGIVLPDPVEGRNELTVVYAEPLREPVTKTFSLFYDSLAPKVAIASWRLAEDGQSLAELTATVTEAAFAEAYLCCGEDVVSQYPEVTIVGTDQYFLRWTDLASYRIKPAVNQVTVGAHDHSGKTGISEALVLTGNLRPEEESARETSIPLPIYKNAPALAHESIYHLRPTAAHTKFAPHRFLSRESVSGESGKDGDFLTRNLYAQKVSPAAEIESFGSSVAVFGDYALVGAPGENEEQGAVYLFELDEYGDWQEKQRLTATDGAPGDLFGFSVAISADYAVVGAYGKNSTAGAAYVFQKNANGVWTEKVKLSGAGEERFGYAVAASEQTIAIGAPSVDNQRGKVYVYEKNEEDAWSWSQRQVLQSNTVYNVEDFKISLTPSYKIISKTFSERGDFFGCSLALSGDELIVGNRNSYVKLKVQVEIDIILTSFKIIGYYSFPNLPGEAFIFKRDNNGNWNVQSKLPHEVQDSTWIYPLEGTFEGNSDQYGHSVSILNNRALVGAYGEDNNTGAVYVYEPNEEGVWRERSKFTTGFIEERFGYAVSLFNDGALVGTYGPETNNHAAYVYRIDDNGNWLEAEVLTNGRPVWEEKFGRGLAVYNDKALLGNSGSTMFYWLDSGNHTIPYDEKYLVFKVRKDLYGTFTKEDLANSIRFEALGYRQGVISEEITEENLRDISLSNTRWLEGFNHYYYVVELPELKEGFANTIRDYFPTGSAGDGYLIHDLGALRVRYDAPVTRENLVDVYLTGGDEDELEDILFYEPNYEDPSAPTNLHPALVTDPATVSFKETAAAEERTVNFWLRLEDEGLWEADYMETVKKRVFTVFSAQGAPLLELGYMGEIMYLHDPAAGVAGEVGDLHTFIDDIKWNMVSLRVRQDRPGLEIGINNQWALYEGLLPETQAQLLAEGVSFYFGPLPEEEYNTGFFSVAGPFYLDQYLQNSEMERISKLSAQYMNTDRSYHFPDAISEFGAQQFQLRIVGNSDDYFTLRENHDPGEGRGYGSLKASSPLCNLLRKVSVGEGKSHVILAEASDCIPFNLEVESGTDSFRLQPTGKTGRYYFGNENSNYGLGQDRWYSVSGRVSAIDPQTTARLVLRINGQEQSWPLRLGGFHFIYDNTETLLSPTQVQMYIETDGPVTLGHDLALNQGNYIIQEDLESSAVKTLFPFGLSGTVHFWYKPLNANTAGLVNCEAVLFDSELIKVWTDLDDQGDAVYMAGIKNSQGQVIKTIRTNAKVNHKWQHLQFSYNFTEPGYDETNVAHLYIDGALAGSLEGIRITPFGSLLGEMPETDNVWMGCDQREIQFAQGYLDEVTLNKYYQHEKYAPHQPAVLLYDQEAAEIRLAIDENLPEPDSCHYFLTGITHSFQGEGDEFPVDLGKLPAGRYRLTVDPVINGRHYQDIIFFNLEQEPGFVLQERTPLLFSDTTQDVYFKFVYDESYRLATEKLEYVGLAARITYQNKGTPQEKIRYLVQDFLAQDSSQWLLGSDEAEGIVWEPLPTDNTGLLKLVFPEIISDTGLQGEFKYFYFDSVFSVEEEFSNLSATALEERIPTVALNMDIEEDEDGNEYKVVVDLTNGQGGAESAVLNEIILDYETVRLETGAGKRDTIDLVTHRTEHGCIELYYDDILHWNGETPLYGEYSFTLRLKHGDEVYMETAAIKLRWKEKEEKAASSVIQKLEITEFSLLHIDERNPERVTAGFYLEFVKNGIGSVSPRIEIISDQNALLSSVPLPSIPVDQTSRIFTGIEIPKGLFQARITLTAEGFVRTRELVINNTVDKPEVALTNSVGSLIQYNNVLFSWKGYYQGQFDEGIKYQYNLDHKGWTSPNSQWRSVRFYNLAEGYHTFQVRALYRDVPSEIRQVTFFVDTQKPVINPEKITVEKIYDEQDVFSAVKLVGAPGAITDLSLHEVRVEGESVAFQPDGSFTSGQIAITTDGAQKIQLSGCDRVNNYSDYTIEVENRITEVLFPQQQVVRYSPFTLVGTINSNLDAKFCIYVADTQTTNTDDYTGWKKAIINPDRTFFVENLFVSPGTPEREAVTTLRMASVFASGKVFEREIEIKANEVILPLEMELSAQAVEGEYSEAPVAISCRANIQNISSWSIDFDGDGVYDQVELIDNPSSPEAQRRSWDYRYSALGVVNPRVRVITTDGDFFSVSKTLIIHERIREVSFKLAPNPISLSSVRMPDEANRVFLLREADGEYLVEVYEIRRNDHYLSQKLFTIKLNAWQIMNPVKIKALNEECLFVAANNQGKGELHQLVADDFGNYLQVAEVELPEEVADFTAQPEALTVTLNHRNTIKKIKLKSGVMSKDEITSIEPALANTTPLGAKTGIDTDGYNFFLADHYNQRVIELSPALRPVGQCGARGNGEAEFIWPELIRYHENRILISDSGRRDVQVFDRDYKPLCTLGYREGAEYNYVEPEFFAEIADFEVIAREEGDRLYYYALVLSRSAGKLSMIRLPQWEELKARVRNNRIVFLQDGEIFTAKPDGGDLRKILSSDSLPRIQGALDYPALSPDGRRLAFTSRIRLYNGSPGDYDGDNIYTYSNLYYFDLENNNLVKVDLGELNGYELERPVFNSNGTKLVFSAKAHRGKWSIYIYDLLTFQVKRVFQTNENARFPYYSPDDRFIVFTSDFGGNEQIEIINTEHPNVRIRVTDNNSRNSLPVWSRVYPGEITHDDLQKTIRSKLAFVSERDNYRGVYYVYLSHEAEDTLTIYDLVKRRVAGDEPDSAALEITHPMVEGDYPCFTGDGRHLIFQYYDGQQDQLKRVDLEKNLTALLQEEAIAYEDLPLIQGANRPAGMKNMITNFIAEIHNGNEIALSWDRYTENDVFYIVQYKPVNSDDLYQNYVLSQTGTVLTGLKMGTDYQVRVFILENEAEVATSYWARVKMPEVVARPSYTIDPDNPYLVRLHAWKPQPGEDYKWRFSWIVENNEIQAQNSQTYLYEFGTSGTKTVFLKAYTEGQTATHISEPMEVEIISDLRPVIQANLAEDSSYIELSAEDSLGKKVNLSSAQWVISGPGRDPIMTTGSRVFVQLDGFQHRINVGLTLERIPVNNERDIVQANRTIDLDIKEVKPVITYEPLPENERLLRFSGEYSMGNINWSGVSWTLFADGGVIYAADGVTTFDYLFPETNQDTVYTVSLTVPRRNDGKTATVSQLVTVDATPIKPKINYEILELKQDDAVVGAKILFDCTESLGSGIDYSLARWVAPIAAVYGEQAVQVGPTAAYNLFGIGEDIVIEVALTLSRRNGTDPITVTKLINISENQLSQGRLIVRKELEEGHYGKVLVMDVLSSTGPNIDWERTEWQIEGEQYVRRGPVVRMDIPAEAEDRSVGFTCLLYRYGAAEPEILHDSVEIKKTEIRPIITADRLSGTQHRMYQLSVLETKGVNIDWERTRWFIYDGGDQAVELRGAVVGYEFPFRAESMGYPVLVQMFLKGSSEPFIAYTTINVEEDLLVPVITTEVDPDRPNVITFSATGSLGSNINWNQALWNFGDAGSPQPGPVVTHEYPLSERAATYRVTLTLSRNLPGGNQEIKTVTREIRMGPDLIRAVIKATKYGDYLILSAEDSEGKGLLLDRCTWLFEGQGDTESYGRNTQEGVQQRESYSQTRGSSTRTGEIVSRSSSSSGGFNFIVHFGSSSSKNTQNIYEETDNESYTHVLDEGYNYTDGENYSFSTQNSHTGAVCRRYIGDSKYLVVTLFVYRMTETGMEGESVTVRINLNDANLLRGAIYGR